MFVSGKQQQPGTENIGGSRNSKGQAPEGRERKENGNPVNVMVIGMILLLIIFNRDPRRATIRSEFMEFHACRPVRVPEIGRAHV